MDYDFTRDVGLIRIRPGRKLPASRVVPAHWEPKSTPLPMKMLTLGCSEGHDATAWYTKILNPRMQGLAGNPSYEAIECLNAPKQGRSGGGLFTTDYYIAGVCNFAEPRGNHGLYATPRSIYSILDRNKLMALYAPVTTADSGHPGGRRSLAIAISSPPPGPPGPGTLTPIARAQSPDADEPKLRRAVAGRGRRHAPAPQAAGDPRPGPTPATARLSRPPAPPSASPGIRSRPPRPPAPTREPTDLKVVPPAGQDQIDSTTTSPTKPHWQVVKPGPGDQAPTTRGE